MSKHIKPVPVEPQRQFTNSIRYFHARIIYQALEDSYHRVNIDAVSYEQRSQAWHELQAARFEYNQALYCIQFPQFA